VTIRGEGGDAVDVPDESDDNSRPTQRDAVRDITVSVERMDGGPRLVIEQAQSLAYDFFTRDASAVGDKAYDAQVGLTDPNRVTVADVVAINTTMRARSPHTAWELLTAAPEPLSWLVAIPPDASLFRMGDDEWQALRPVLAQALAAAIGPYRNLSVATKVLHLKRPWLFPVLDSLVLQQLGGLGRPHLDVLGHLRSVGVANRKALDLIAVSLAQAGLRPRSDVRVMDALLWSSHPAAGLAGELGGWEHAIRPATR